MSVSSGEESDENIDNDENSDNIVSRYDLDNYDDDDDGEVGQTSLLNLGNLTVFASNEDDPYLENNDNEDVSLNDIYYKQCFDVSRIT